MQRAKKSLIARLLLILALVILPCTVLASVQALAASEETVTFASVTVNKTIMYKTKAMNEIVMTIPKGADVTVLDDRVKVNVCKIEYKKRIGFVYGVNLLDSHSPVVARGAKGTYGKKDTTPPRFYAQTKAVTDVRASASASSTKKGILYSGAYVGVYGESKGYYVVSYGGQRCYAKSTSFTKKDLQTSTMYVRPEGGAHIRSWPEIPAKNKDMNVFDLIPYQTKVTVLSHYTEKIYTDKSMNHVWYRVLVKYKNKYYVEGYMRDDVLSKEAGKQAESNGNTRIIDTGTKEKSVVRDGPDGEKINSLPNGTHVHATGEIKYGKKNRHWAKITSPVVGWVPASHIGFGW